MHCLWTLPAGDAGFALRWQAIKFVFSRRLPKHESRSPNLAAKRERGIWQRRYWEHLIRDDADYQPAPLRLHPLQPVQAWPCDAGKRLAVFKRPPGSAYRDLLQGLVWW
jgi:REP element-mobilizing transposase RayT